MRTFLGLALACSLATGCSHFVVRTDNKVALDGPVEAVVKTDLPPVSQAGPVLPIIVEPGAGVGTVAIVDVDGLLLNTPFAGPGSVGENPVAVFREKLDAAAADPTVRAVVLRVNSPGGGVSACLTMHGDLVRFKQRTNLPVVACLLDQATGGAYVLASAADQVVAAPATVTGGLGVILNLYNLQDLMAQFNIIPQPITAGENADLATSARKLSEEEDAILQQVADSLHDQLIANVRASRPAATGEGTFDGRILTAGGATERGLIDGTADLNGAIQLAANAGGVCNGPPTVVLYRRTNDPAHSIYAVTANIPLQGAGLLPSIPGIDRTKLPTFLSVWQPELTLEKLAGK